MKRKDLKPYRALVRSFYPRATVEFDTDEGVFIAVRERLKPKRGAEFDRDPEAGCEFARADTRRAAWKEAFDLLSRRARRSFF